MMRGILRSIAGLALLALVVAARPAMAAPLEQLKALASQGAAVSVRVVDLNDGRTLAAMNAGVALTPASVSKLYTAAAALEQWGADYRFTTRVLYTGEISAGELRGDLILRGAGDPGLTNAQMWTLAQRVRAAGITKVNGAVMVDQSLLGRVPCATEDRCNAKVTSRDAYNAPLSAAGFDYSNICLRVAPGPAVGTPAKVGFEPFELPMFGVRGTVRTLPAGAPTKVDVVRVTADGRNWFYARGGIAVDAPARCYYRSVSHPALYAGQALIAFLRQAGVEVKHSTARIVSSADEQARPLAEVKGTTLGDQLRGMLVYSNNYMADLLALDLARTTAEPPITMAKAGAWLTRYARRIDAESPWPGARKGSPRLDSGSGLTPDSRVSADDVVALLAAAYRNYGDFPAFLGALTVPDQTPVNMLKGGPEIWATHVAVKTGSLSRPVSVFALAGYLRLNNGHWGAFAVIVNGTRQQPRLGLERSLEAVRSDLVSILRSNGDEPAAGQASLRSGQPR
jgi:D-alanyl-D-alanine carboxypeptidase/D-alanyl-D-alanine-endopeptidase (penicillin-binding protein 4)